MFKVFSYVFVKRLIFMFVVFFMVSIYMDFVFYLINYFYEIEYDLEEVIVILFCRQFDLLLKSDRMSLIMYGYF